MPTLIGPSHFLFYASLHRRLLWLERLAKVFSDYSKPAWVEAKRELDEDFKNIHSRLSSESEFGSKPSLHRVLDDTPIDSFLASLHDDLSAYEIKLFQLMFDHVGRASWEPELEQASTLWGRQLAQECLIDERQGQLVRDTRALKGLFEGFQNILMGGEFIWKPFLLRRYTADELQYELRSCAHRRNLRPVRQKVSATSPVDFACWMESMVYRGFAQALVPDVHFERHCKGGYCQDNATLFS